MAVSSCCGPRGVALAWGRGAGWVGGLGPGGQRASDDVGGGGARAFVSALGCPFFRSRVVRATATAAAKRAFVAARAAVPPTCQPSLSRCRALSSLASPQLAS